MMEKEKKDEEEEEEEEEVTFVQDRIQAVTTLFKSRTCKITSSDNSVSYKGTSEAVSSP